MESLSAYLPADRRYALAGRGPLLDYGQGAALFADISGFTRLTALLAQELGPQRGAEEITRQLDRIYTALITQVHAYAGSVISFSGDAITCWFGDEPPGAEGRDDGPRRATACALAIQMAMAGFETTRTPAGTAVSVGVKVAVAAGTTRRFLVGQPQVQRFDVLAGPLVDRTAAAEQLLAPGEIAVGAEVLGHFGGQLRIREWRRTASGEHVAVVASLAQPIPTSPWLELPEIDAALACQWLLAPLYDRFMRAASDFLAELRPTVGLFLSFSGLNYQQDDAAGLKLDQYICWLQDVLGRFEGHLLQLTIGDKGSYCHIAFGALMAHEDDPARAIAAALALQALPSELGFIKDVRMGISRGTVHVGNYGAPGRRTFGVQGTETNLAARLMARAAPGQILVSSQVAAAAQGAYDFQELGRLQLKGFSEPLLVLAVQAKRLTGPSDALLDRSRLPLVGRAEEQEALRAKLRALQDGRSGVVVIEGEAGIGKSRLLQAFLQDVAQARRPVLVGAGDAIEEATAYFAWRPIFRQIFSVAEGESAADLQAKVLPRLAADPRLAELAPLLDAVLPLNLPDNDLTAQMTGEARANSTRSLLVRLLASASGALGLVLVLEDAQWLDSASWALASQVRLTIAPLLLVIVTRQVPEAISPQGEYAPLLAEADVEWLRLTSLTADQTLHLVCERLGVTSLPAPVAALIYRRAEGHPFFSLEIALALRDAGHIRLHDGQASLAIGAQELSDLDFPLTIRGVVTSRIDRLDGGSQLTLKVASVIGRIFAYRLLRRIYPNVTETEPLPTHLTTLERVDIIVPESPEPELAYRFQHTIVQEIVYDQMTFTQRRQLHHSAAEWYEHRFAGDLTPYYPLLAHHWGRAEDAPRTIDYLEKAGNEARRNFANEEAIAFFSQALALDARSGRLTDPRRRALWRLRVGEACVHWTRYADGRQHLERGLELLGKPAPAANKRLAKAGRLAGAFGRQFWHRLRPDSFPGARRETQAELLEASRAYSRLVEVYYHSGDVLLSIFAAFHALNLAELAGNSAELAEAYAPIGAFFTFLRRYKIADAYFARALQAARKANSLAAESYVLLAKATYETGIGSWAEARASIDQLIENGRRLGSARRYNDGLQLLTIWLYSRGEFQACLGVADELLASARQANDYRFQGYGLYARTYSHFHLGQLDAAANTLEELTALITTDPGVTDAQLALNTHGLACLVHARRGDLGRALEAAGGAARLVEGVLPTSYWTLPGYRGPAELYLALGENGQREAPIDHGAGAAVRALSRFAGTFPIGRPSAAICRGLYEWLQGRRRRAWRTWTNGLDSARRLEMPYETGRLAYEIGRRLDPADPARAAHLQQAADCFEQVGAAFELAGARTALQGDAGQVRDA